MDETAKSPRLDPLPPETTPEMKEEFDSFFKTLGFVPNSVLTMQRKPKLAKAFVQMQRALWDPDSKVDRGLKRLVAHAASRTADDAYSMAHTASGALHFGIDAGKARGGARLPDEPAVQPAERAAFDLAVAASSQSECGDRRDLRRTAQALERGADRRDRRRHRNGRLSVALERHAWRRRSKKRHVSAPAAARSRNQVTPAIGRRRAAGRQLSPSRSLLKIALFSSPATRKAACRLLSSAGYVKVMRASGLAPTTAATQLLRSRAPPYQGTVRRYVRPVPAREDSHRTEAEPDPDVPRCRRI